MRKKILDLRNLGYFINYFKKSELFELTIFLTSACNFRCSHCFYWKKVNSNDDLRLDEFERLASKMPQLARIIFTGGEPFLRKDIDKVIPVFYKFARPSYITIPTNGFFTNVIAEKTKEILKKCPNAFINISLSLDELREKRDKIVNRAGSFQNLVKTASELKKLQKTFSNLGITAITTQTSQNENRLDKIFDFANDVLGVDNFGFSVVRGNPQIKETTDISPEKYKEMCNKISKHYQSKKTKKSIIPIRPLFLANRDLVYEYTHKTLAEKSFQMKCYAGILRGVILENGDVYPCEVLMERGKKYLIGNLKDFNMDFSELWNSKKRYEIVNEIKKMKCFCTHGCDMSVNTFFGSKFIFKIFAKLFPYYFKA